MTVDRRQTERNEHKPVWKAALTGVFCLLVLPITANAEDKVPELDDATAKTLEAVEADFDDSLKDLGELAGEVYACEGDDEKRGIHEARVKNIYNEVNKLFGTDRAFLFASAFGYGAANELDKKTCAELSDEFEDRYGAISEKYDLID